MMPNTTAVGLLLAGVILGCIVPGTTLAASEIKLDRDHLARVLANLPQAPFQKEGQYRGAVADFRLVGISPKSREVVVACVVSGEFDEAAILAEIRKQNGAPKTSTSNALPLGGMKLPLSKPSPGNAAKPTTPDSGKGWQRFRFDAQVAINIEPNAQGSPKLRFKVEEVKRKELTGLVGPLARVMGQGFDRIVTSVANAKAQGLTEHLNAEVLRKVALFRDYGLLCRVDYFPTQLVMLFDVTRFRLQTVAGYLYPSPHPGTVPLYRWVNPRRGDHFYTVSTLEPNSDAYRPEGIAGYVFAQHLPETVPLIRYRGKQECVYTTSKDVAVLKHNGYQLEGIACFLFDKPAPETVPFYRFVDPVRGLHFYTTHPQAEFAK